MAGRTKNMLGYFP